MTRALSRPSLLTTTTMSSKAVAASDLNPRTKHYEFLGPPGALAITIGVPAMTYALYFGCSENHGGCPPPIDTSLILDSLSDLSWWKGLWDTQAAIAYFAWYAFVVVAWLILPGDWVDGVPMRNGVTKKYKINGAWQMSPPRGVWTDGHVAFSTALLTFGVVAGVIYRYGPQPLTFIYEHWVGLVTASIVMSVVQALWCYLSSFRQGALLALGGNSGNPIYDVRILCACGVDVGN